MPVRRGHKLFYRRPVAESEMLVCLKCERDTELPATAARMFILYEDGVIFSQCFGCGAKERLVIPRDPDHFGSGAKGRPETP